ncbi:MAG TPA: hypothetical protein VM912_11920, partial [Terriglobales bacterium]|nr:hypothetical protein [Terriglobales bacterium]
MKLPIMRLRESWHRTQVLVVALVLSLCLTTLSCTPEIPNRVTNEEIALYREWLKHRFASKAPEQLYLDDQTFVFDPLEHLGCGGAMHKQDHVPWSLMKALHSLGNSDYEVDVSPKVMQLPWSYQILNTRNFPKQSPGLHVIGFSRIAFNHSGHQGLFAFSDSCAAGLCGTGGAVLASKQRDTWQFNELKSCFWVY